MISTLLNLFYKEVKGESHNFQEDYIQDIKDTFITRAYEFLQRLIDNDHIEKIESGNTLNDYIKYIATTDDPVQTLSNMLK